MLENLLDSLIKLTCPANITVTIDIIENHTEKHLTKLIQRISDKSTIPIKHHWEQRLGIPIARNTALKVAKSANATHIIFIDDDERVTPCWLSHLWSIYLQHEESSIIQGPVIPSIDTDENTHLHSYFERPIKATGTPLDTCATNNVIIPLSIFDDYGLKFDESRPLAGGTDSKLFREAHTHGIPMRYCAEAIVYEDIPDERINISWLGKRHFRIGLTMGQHEKKSGAGLRFPISQTGETIRNFTRSLLCRIKFNKIKSDKRWLRCCKAAGKTLGYFDVTIDSYKKVEGN